MLVSRGRSVRIGMGSTSRIRPTSICGLVLCAAVAGCGSSQPVVPPLGPLRAGRCAAHVPTTLHRVLWPAAERALAPPGAIAMQLCRYSADGSRPILRLVSSRRVTKAIAVAFFQRELDGLSEQHGTVVCPNDDGSQVVAALTYPQSRTLAVSVGLRGCETATNGTVSRSATGFGTPPEKAPPLVTQLERILPPTHS
jgi:hypothetical protein